MHRLVAILAVLWTSAAAAQFNSSAEVKPILKMIKPQWISVRDWDGQDLIYFTILEVYRCGLEQIRYVVNDGKPRVWQTEPCEGNATFSDIPADRLPFVAFPAGHVRTFRVELTYDDGDTEWAEYVRRGETLQLGSEGGR